MQPTSPASELRAAASKIRSTAMGADYQPNRWRIDVAGPLATTDWLGPSHDALTATWRQAEHIALWHPGVAELVAAVLDSAARAAELEYGKTDAEVFLSEELDLARAINGGA